MVKGYHKWREIVCTWWIFLQCQRRWQIHYIMSIMISHGEFLLGSIPVWLCLLCQSNVYPSNQTLWSLSSFCTIQPMMASPVERLKCLFSIIEWKYKYTISFYMTFHIFCLSFGQCLFLKNICSYRYRRPHCWDEVAVLVLSVTIKLLYVYVCQIVFTNNFFCFFCFHILFANYYVFCLFVVVFYFATSDCHSGGIEGGCVWPLQSSLVRNTATGGTGRSGLEWGQEECLIPIPYFESSGAQDDD